MVEVSYERLATIFKALQQIFWQALICLNPH